MLSKPLAILAAGAIGMLIAAGCTKPSDQSSTTSSTTTTTSTTSASTAPNATATTAAMSTTTTTPGDAVHGKAIFAQNCAGCHGASGEGGGVGPTLKNEKSRKNFDQAVAQIKDPQPPMPKLFPGTLSEKDVQDVAAFVETL